MTQKSIMLSYLFFANRQNIIKKIKAATRSNKSKGQFEVKPSIYQICKYKPALLNRLVGLRRTESSTLSVI